MSAKNKPTQAQNTLSSTQAWWSNGIRFQCQGSGKCCISRDEYGFVFLTLQDRQRIAKHLKLPTGTFTKRYCTRLKGLYHLNERSDDPNCLFLKDKKCSIYLARPTQCRTWPFWPEVMNAKTWKKEVASFCPGVGKGPLVPVDIIEKNLAEQDKSEKHLLQQIKS